MKEDKRKLLVISVDCWLKEADRLMQWIAYSGASREAIKEAQNNVKAFARRFDVSKLSPALNVLIDEKAVMLSKTLARAKRARMTKDKYSVRVQVPSERDLQEMKQMPTGTSEDQYERIKKIKAAIYEFVPEDKIIETGQIKADYWIDRVPWEVLCQCISRNESNLIDRAFDAIPKDNPVMAAMLTAHSRAYWLAVMHHCASLNPGELSELMPGNPDVLIGPRTFEVFIHDFITTLEQRQRLNFSFGLPSHHASYDLAGGFCVFNKMAMLIAFEEQKATVLVHHVIIGLDINEDNGTGEILINQKHRLHTEIEEDLFSTHITHIDVHDSRTYPWRTAQEIDSLMPCPATEENGMTVWQQGFRRYKSIDLADKPLRRKAGQRHPAIDLVLSELEMALLSAETYKAKVIIYLPTGWDSHVDETAAAGKLLNGKTWLNASQSRACRFNDEDWRYFNQGLADALQRHQAIISRVYFQLEGGYTATVNRNQIEILTETLLPRRNEPTAEVAESSSGRNLRQRRF